MVSCRIRQEIPAYPSESFCLDRHQIFLIKKKGFPWIEEAFLI